MQSFFCQNRTKLLHYTTITELHISMSMQQQLSKCILTLVAFPLIMSGCTTSSQKPHNNRYPIPIIGDRQLILNPQNAPPVPNQRMWVMSPPANYLLWLRNSGNQSRVTDYEQYLKDNRVHSAVPTHQLLRSARDWQRCGRDPYAVPSPELWNNALPTLKIIQYLVDKQILRDFEVTSVYRDYSLNLCAGGAAGSKHVYNSAIDFRLGPEFGASTYDYLQIQDTKNKLCEFWSKYGQTLNMGLGVYASGQIHIDTQGYRTWGADLTRNTSICQQY